jgi:hypothetical protein
VGQVPLAKGTEEDAMNKEKKELSKEEMKQVQGAGWTLSAKLAPEREPFEEEGEGGGRTPPFEIEGEEAPLRREKQALPKRF